VTIDFSSDFVMSNKTLVDCLVHFAQGAGYDAGPFLKLAFDAVWRDRADVSDPGTVQYMADKAHLPGTELVAMIQRSDTASIYQTCLDEALRANVFGTPGFVFNGEVFWGQDRLDFLRDAIAGGRAPYRSDRLPLIVGPQKEGEYTT